MGVIFDILGMLAMRAAIITIILNLLVNLHEALYKNAERIFLNESITAPAQTISSDLIIAGYNVVHPLFLTRGLDNKKFKVAKDTAMYFRCDLGDDNTWDSIYYYLNPTTGANKSLYRSVNLGTGMLVASDVDTFKVLYYTSTGTAVVGTADVTVKAIKVSLVIKSNNTEVSATDGTSGTTTRRVKWEKYFFPPNL